MQRLKKKIRSPDIILLLVTLILVTVGTAMIYSSSSIIALEKFKDGQYFLKKQILFVFLGLTSMMVLMTKIPYTQLKKLAYPGMLLSLILLSMLLIPALGMKRGGATRWLNLGGISFQVTEMVKIAMVVFLAHLLTRKA